MKKASKLTTFVLTGIIAGSSLFSGCESQRDTAMLIGGLGGAGLGYAAGGDAESALIGGGIGTLGGYFVGGWQEKATQRRVDAKYRELMSMHDKNMIRREIGLFGDEEFGDNDYWVSPEEKSKAYQAFSKRWSYEQYKSNLEDRAFVEVLRGY